MFQPHSRSSTMLSALTTTALGYVEEARNLDVYDLRKFQIFQQRKLYYPNIAADMDPARSAGQFFNEMVKVKGWKTMDVGKLCQAVQRSAFPGRYDQHLPQAKKICAADGF